MVVEKSEAPSQDLEREDEEEADPDHYFPVPRDCFEPLVENLEMRLTRLDVDDHQDEIERALAILRKLPDYPENAEIHLTLSLEYGHPAGGEGLSSEFVGFEIADGELSFTRGGYLVSPGVGSDSFSRVIFRCALDGRWRGDLDSIEQWNAGLTEAALGSLSLTL